MRIAGAELSSFNRPFLVAEAGSAHHGQADAALRLTRAAVETGADAVTFQEIDEKRLYAELRDLPVPPQPRVGWDCLRECRDIARGSGLAFSVCVTDAASLAKAMALEIDFIKIVSYDVTFLPFLRECGQTGLPVLMSTGASLFAEVEQALSALNASDRVVLYHTDCGYPTQDSEVNLRRMLQLHARFGLPVGYCDHTDHGLSCLAAAALGAAVIEKHFALTRTAGEGDAAVSISAPELADLFRDIKRVAAMLGDGADRVAPGDVYRRYHLRRSVALNRAIRQGETIDEGALTMLRPGGGLGWPDRGAVVGKVAARDLPRRHQISNDDVR